MIALDLVRKLIRWAQYLLGVLILLGFLAGWLLVLGSAHDLTLLYAARSWPAKEAVITHSYARQVRGMQNRRYWHAEIAGKYVDGSGKFNVSRHAYGFHQWTRTQEKAEAVARKYPVGTRLNVFPEPEKPGNVILEPGISAAPSWIALWVGVGLILLPCGLYVWGRLRSRGKPTHAK